MLRTKHVFRLNGLSLAFGDGKTAKMIPTSTDCYSCHAAHAAVDTTFVQFYPTLLPIATSKGTLSAAYQKEIGSPVTNRTLLGSLRSLERSALHIPG